MVSTGLKILYLSLYRKYICYLSQLLSVCVCILNFVVMLSASLALP
jgi:hypothetical protein